MGYGGLMDNLMLLHETAENQAINIKPLARAK